MRRQCPLMTQSGHSAPVRWTPKPIAQAHYIPRLRLTLRDGGMGHGTLSEVPYAPRHCYRRLNFRSVRRGLSSPDCLSMAFMLHLPHRSVIASKAWPPAVSRCGSIRESPISKPATALIISRVTSSTSRGEAVTRAHNRLSPRASSSQWLPTTT